MTETGPSPSDPEQPEGTLRRRLRAAFSADVANFSGNVSVSETGAFGNLQTVLRVARQQLDRYDGVVISMPGDGLFGLFESAVCAVQCALAIQEQLAADAAHGGMRLRIGIHLGDVLFKGDVPFGETLNIAARLQSLADPGGTLVSGAIVDAVSARISATFEARGVPMLKNIPRRIATYAIYPSQDLQTGSGASELEPLDHTMRLPTHDLAPTQGPDAETSGPTSNSDIGKMPQSASIASAQRETLIARLARLRPGSTPSTSHSDEAPPPSAPFDDRTQPKRKHPHLTGLDSPLTAEAIEIFADAFAVHLGPVGRVMVRRKAQASVSLADLLVALEGDIPTPSERLTFRSRIMQKFAR